MDVAERAHRLLVVSGSISIVQCTDRYPTVVKDHVITADLEQPFDDGEGAGGDVYAVSERTQVLSYEDGTVRIAVNTFGEGRAVYSSGLPYSFTNSRTLQRTLYWAAGREDLLSHWFTTHPATEVAWYPEHRRMLVTNNAYEAVTTTVLGDGRQWELEIGPMGSVWVDVDCTPPRLRGGVGTQGRAP